MENKSTKSVALNLEHLFIKKYYFMSKRISPKLGEDIATHMTDKKLISRLYKGSINNKQPKKTTMNI